jgi:predicted nucleic acid-binding protein
LNLSFDLAQAAARLAAAARQTSLVRRDREQLIAASAAILARPMLIPDSCVYIDWLQGHLPLAIRNRMQADDIWHSALCIAELTHGLGRLDPLHAASARNQAIILRAIAAIPPQQVIAPSAQGLGEAGIVAGAAARITQRPRDGLSALLVDAALGLQALDIGAAVITRNHRDFDVLGQLLPELRIVFYDRD